MKKNDLIARLVNRKLTSAAQELCFTTTASRNLCYAAPANRNLCISAVDQRPAQAAPAK
jgi:hypothetical protein